jgi:hypothetical protein
MRSIAAHWAVMLLPYCFLVITNYSSEHGSLLNQTPAAQALQLIKTNQRRVLLHARRLQFHRLLSLFLCYDRKASTAELVTPFMQ